MFTLRGRLDTNSKLKALGCGTLLVALLLTLPEAHAQFPAGSFWKRRVSSIKFTTSAQTILAGNCSGVTTVGNYNANNVLTNVSSNLTVNLSSGSGSTTFYSDINCVVPITSITIASGTNSASFYFVNTAVQSITLTASATNYANVTQNETINTNGFVWTGGGANALWSTGGNWSGGVAPSSSQYALFDGTCVSNCSPNISATMSVGGVRMTSAYSGTITQATNSGITVSPGGWSQQGGTFVGSNVDITISGGVTIAGGSYTTSSGITIVNGSGYALLNSPTFNQSAGTLRFSGSGNYTITPGTYHYNNVDFNGNGPGLTLNGTMYVDGLLGFTAFNANGQINSGTIIATSNINLSGYGMKGTAIVKVVGNAAGQTITGVSGAFMPTLRIEAGANNVTLSGTVQPCNEYTVTSVGTLTTTGSTLSFENYCPASITVGAEHYNNLTFKGWGDTYNLNNGTVYVDGTLTFASPYAAFANVNSGTIVLTGNLTTVDYGNKGSVVVKLVGNAAGQTITGLSTAAIPSMRIEAGTNNVTLSGTVRPYTEYTVNSVGTLTTTGSTLYFSQYSGTSIKVGTEHYNNVNFSCFAETFTLNNTTMYVDGTLTLACSNLATLNSGTIRAYGNITTGGYGIYNGNAAIQMVGGTAATVTQANSSARIPGLAINKTAGTTVSWGSAGYLNATGQGLTVTSGNVNMAGYALTIGTGGLSLNGNTITKGGGVLTVNGTTVGTGSLYGGTVAP